jgi:hypothetical protein
MVLVLLLIVGLLIAVRIGGDDPVEILAWTLLGAVGVAPALVVGTAWLMPTFVGPGLLAAVAGLVGAALLAAGGRRGLREHPWRAPTAGEAAALLAAGGVAGLTGVLHTDAELLLSLAAWLDTGEAECFYMQTFALVGELNPGRPAAGVRDAWSIVNSPGNIIYTAPLMATLESATFRAVDVLFRVLIFLFVQLTLFRWTRHRLLALLGGLFAVLNPFMLSVEVLDRNVVAAGLTAALLFSLRTRPEQLFAHGWLLGLLTVSGLRFLPVCFAVPVVAVPQSRGWTVRQGGTLLAATVVPLAVAAPHLRHHGLHRLGETEGLLSLVSMTLEHLPRTPFLPFPTGIFYFLDVLDLLGLLVCALAVVGALRLVRREPAWAVALVVPVLAIAFVLGIQRDWIEGDKARIALEALVPIVLLAGLGAADLFEGAHRRRSATRDLVLATLVLAVGGLGVARIEVPPDPGTYLHHPVYQTDTPERMAPARRTLRRFGLLPDYRRPGLKLDIARKRAEEATLRAVLFAPGSARARRAAAAGWWGGDDADPPPRRTPSASTVDLAIDLARLPGDPEGAVRTLPPDPSREVFVDLTAGDELLDIYFRTAVVPWQPQPLPMTALPRRAETWALGELYLDLNAFTAYGTDEFGFVRVAPIHFRQLPDGRRAALAHAMTALPNDDRSSVVVVRIPEEFRVLVRDWLVDGVSGTPHRIDSWLIETDGTGARVRFLYGEPESYL